VNPRILFYTILGFLAVYELLFSGAIVCVAMTPKDAFETIANP